MKKAVRTTAWKSTSPAKRAKTPEEAARSRHSKRLREEMAVLAQQRLTTPVDAVPGNETDPLPLDDVLVDEPERAPPLASQDDEAPKLKLIARVNRAIEQELEEIEDIAARGFNSRYRTEAERRARTLASLARTLREVMLLREQSGEGEANADDDDAIPRDLDEFRRELSRRLEAMVARGAQRAAGDDVPS